MWPVTMIEGDEYHTFDSWVVAVFKTEREAKLFAFFCNRYEPQPYGYERKFYAQRVPMRFNCS